MQNQNQQLNINVNDLNEIVCKDCRGTEFIQIVNLKHASALVSPTGKDHTFIVPIGFKCTNCNCQEQEIKKEELLN